MWFLPARPLCFNDIFANDAVFNHLALVMIFLNVPAAQTLTPSVFAAENVIIIQEIWGCELFQKEGLGPRVICVMFTRPTRLPEVSFSVSFNEVFAVFISGANSETISFELLFLARVCGRLCVEGCQDETF